MARLDRPQQRRVPLGFALLLNLCPALSGTAVPASMFVLQEDGWAVHLSRGCFPGAFPDRTACCAQFLPRPSQPSSEREEERE